MTSASEAHIHLHMCKLTHIHAYYTHVKIEELKHMLRKTYCNKIEN